MSDDDLFSGPPPEAHARHADPSTSHQAAAAVTPDLRVLQATVADYARRAGPEGFVDLQLQQDLKDEGSTYRTRRAELTARNIILDTGRKRRHGDSPRMRIVWVHRDFMPGAPPVIDAPEPPSPAPKVDDADKREGRAWVGKLRSYARTQRGMGFAVLAAELELAADVMARLSR